MNRHLFPMAVFLIFLNVPGVFSAADVPDHWQVHGVKKGDVLNIRKEAEKERITKERPRWCHIEYKGVRGWVAGRYLREGYCDDSTSKPQE